MELEQLVREAVVKVLQGQGPQAPAPSEGLIVPVGVSARHVHLSPEDVQALFGPGHELQVMKELQPGQYACVESVTLVGPKGAVYGVRVLGPARGRTQVEIALSDGFTLGIRPPVRPSGDLKGSPGIALVGPAGAVRLQEGVIAARRHIHMPPYVANAWGLRNGQNVQVLTPEGDRQLTLGQVQIRVDKSFKLELHLDTDEANTAGLKTGDLCRIVPRQEG